MSVKIDVLKCTGCGNCTFLCPVGVLVIDGVKCGVQDGCIDCGTCVDACSFKAIKLES